jgi:hypothetical protein
MSYLQEQCGVSLLCLDKIYRLHKLYRDLLFSTNYEVVPAQVDYWGAIELLGILVVRSNIVVQP